MKCTGVKCTVSLCLCLVLVACNNTAQDHTAAHSVSNEQTAEIGALQSWCAQCHTPPSAKLHRADEWPGVVRRMEHHRLDARMLPIPADARKTLLTWLQAHAKF